MSFFVFIIYLLFCLFLLQRISFFKNCGIPSKTLLILFIIKVVAGCAYGWIYSLPAYSATSDTWRFYNDSLSQTDLLLSDPLKFIRTMWSSEYLNSSNLFLSNHSYWNVLKDQVMVKLMAVLNAITGKRYFANVILFNFMCFAGPVSFYRLMSKILRGPKQLLILFIFLLPSALFWTSGIHKDGLAFMCISLMLFSFYYVLISKKIFKYAVLFFTSASVLFIIKNYLLFALLLSLPVWWMAERLHTNKKRAITIYLLCLFSVFVCSGFLSQHWNILSYLSQKNAEFNQLPGNSKMNVPVLLATWKSFFYYSPYALDIIFFRPHLSELNFFYLTFFLEQWLLIIIVSCFLIRRNFHHLHGAGLCILCFSGIGLGIYACSTTFTGAIVRYRNFFYPLLLPVLTEKIVINKNKYVLFFIRFLNFLSFPR